MQNMKQAKAVASLIESGKETTIYLMNGYQMHGVIEESDDAVVIIKTYKGRQMVYAHAISTINID